MSGLELACSDARAEAIHAIASHPRFHSAHEGFGVLLEEVHELMLHVWINQARRDLGGMRKEAIQIAAVALRFASECCDEEVGRR